MDAYEASLLAARLERYDLLLRDYHLGTVCVSFHADLCALS